MLKKRITFIVIPTHDGQVREYRFSRGLLWGAALLIVAMAGALGFYARGYHQRVDQQASLDQLRVENQDLMRGLDVARKTVELLEESMEALAVHDERLRAYHMMEPLSAEERMGGAGGSEELPEDYMALPSRKRALLGDLKIRLFRLQQEARVQASSFEMIRQRFLEREGSLKHLPTISPVSREKTWISSGFGYRADPFTGRRAFHSGVDFAGRTGTPVYATADGIVTYAYHDLRLGNVVVIEHDIMGSDEQGQVYTRDGVYQTEYGHLKQIQVKVGDKVRRSQQIGLMGNTGRSTGPHLHYAVRYQDRRRGQYKGYENPKLFLLDEVSGDAKVANWWYGGE